MKNTVYILRSEKLDLYYIGFTSDIGIRMDFHKNSEANTFTQKAEDWEIAFTIECSSKKQALAIEAHIKKMKSKVYIQNLMQYPEMVYKLKQKYS